ncbi:MAG: tRNA pseudouridine(38-40) synthase TruA [Gemmatimonadaceae bacterium]|nr:tRNA pseudouridine(38-40) synthase TruA [Gemmatimonadaceae bacterium]MCW5825262.1 tRNA pseudouridine(38-40) synthase TruA [Gemmatimonadaceae bacterium]
MAERTLQLVLHYDGAAFAGWQVQPGQRTVQGELERVLERLCAGPVRVTGAGRTDAGVHARGQAAGITVPAHWTAPKLRRVLNEQLDGDVWVAAAHEMHAGFHARFDATGRRYSYTVGLDAEAGSPFRRRWELPWDRDLDRAALDWCAERLVGRYAFFGFAVRGTAPETDDHVCEVRLARWRAVSRDDVRQLVFDVAANRFLHHMVRFLVGTMLAVASGARPREEFAALLQATVNDEVSPPAPPAGLCLEHVEYPPHLYLDPQPA